MELKTMLSVITLLAGIYLLLGLLLFVFQRGMLYFPTPEVTHPFGEMTITSDGERITVVVVNPDQDNALLYFGGNAEAVALNGRDFEATLAHHTTYLVNYRGYGSSTGKPSEQGLYADALQVYDTVKNRHQRVSVFGRSLGSGIATYLASRRDVHRLVLVAPFDSVRNVAQSLYPIFPAGLILLDEYDSLSRIDQISSPTLILIAEQDNVIPARFSLALASAFPRSQATTHVIAGTGHNTISAVSAYYTHIREFLEGN